MTGVWAGWGSGLNAGCTGLGILIQTVSAGSSHPGAQHTHPQVLPPLQGNRSLPKEAQGSHYITLQTGGAATDITASPEPGSMGPLPSTCPTTLNLLVLDQDSAAVGQPQKLPTLTGNSGIWAWGVCEM